MKNQSASGARGGYERSDAQVGPLFGFAIGLALLVAAVLAVSALLDTERRSAGAAPHPMAEGREGPSGPLLQPAPALELESYLVKERAALSTYGWVDREAGVARIPIERAMEILLERGFEVHSPAGGEER